MAGRAEKKGSSYKKKIFIVHKIQCVCCTKYFEIYMKVMSNLAFILPRTVCMLLNITYQLMHFYI